MSEASAAQLPIPPDIAPEQTLSAPEWGMACFLFSEVAFFGTLIVTYVAFMGRDVVGPTPAQALTLPIVLISTLCLLSSSVVIHAAERALEREEPRMFALFLAGTIALGIAFLVLTAFEWHDLIYVQNLTIGRNLFGTTYFTLVGFHAFHVTVGVIVMLIVLALALAREINSKHRLGVRLVAWYWHFVDAVWVVVFLVVYIASRSGGA
jgi:cytochrome c oxidase subunit 3/cytochrome o ubiquinol oxidase subunit 3